jgi:hypothetical protein
MLLLKLAGLGFLRVGKDGAGGFVLVGFERVGGLVESAVLASFSSFSSNSCF